MNTRRADPSSSIVETCLDLSVASNPADGIFCIPGGYRRQKSQDSGVDSNGNKHNFLLTLADRSPALLLSPARSSHDNSSRAFISLHSSQLTALEICFLKRLNPSWRAAAPLTRNFAMRMATSPILRPESSSISSLALP